DYVGPSEYAWDFNQPGSMAGFGPLDAKRTVVDFLSKTARVLEADAQQQVEADEPPLADPQSEQPESTSPDEPAETGAGEVSSEAEPPATGLPPPGPVAMDQGREPEPSRQVADFSQPR